MRTTLTIAAIAIITWLETCFAAGVAWGAEPAGQPGVAGDTFSMPTRVSVPADPVPFPALKIFGDSAASVAPWQLDRAINQPAPMGAQRPQANDEVSRGPAALVYAKAAPAIVFIENGNTFGSGFIVDDSGWMITNNHVVTGAPIQISNGARFVKVILGRMKDGVMTAESRARAAWVYKTDERRDLALLKLVKPAEAKLPTIPLARSVPTPGNDCVAIGHPKAGLLWTVRQGQITGVGQWPRDSTTVMFAVLSASGSASSELNRTLENLPRRKVVLSSCGINPGDSGGPLLDEQGQLIGVTFGIPKNVDDPSVSLDKFAYHVHLDELKGFIADRPSRLQPYIPDPWAPAVLSCLTDKAGDGVRDTLLFAVKADQVLSGFQCDLAHKSSPRFEATRLADPENRKLWQFQFAYTRLPTATSFYDTRNRGKIDLILTDFNRDGIADLELRLVDDQWKVVPTKGQKLIDASHFVDKTLSDRLQKILQHWNDGQKAAKPPAAAVPPPKPGAPASVAPKPPVVPVPPAAVPKAAPAG